MTRELLLGATRIRQLEEDEHEDLSEDVIAPGKLTAAELREHRGARGRIAPGKLTGAEHAPVRESQPGKLSLADVGRGVMPAAALRQATAFHDRRIHRDAAHDHDIDHGTLASAFSFIDSAGGAPLPAALAAQLGTALGVDLSRVRIHTDARAAEAAARLGARAFTIGEDVYFAAGAYDPVGAAGVRLIAHEIAHVAQNYRGTAPTGAGVSRPSDGHERDADRFADRFTARPLELPWLRRLEQMTSLPATKLEPIAGEIQSLARHAMVAGAGVVREVVKLAPASPARKRMLDELGRVSMPAPRAPSRGQIHRDKADKSKGKVKDEPDTSTVEERFAYFVQKHPKIRIDAAGGNRRSQRGRERARFGFEDGEWTRRYWHSSAEKFQLAKYQQIVDAEFKKAVTDRDLQKIFHEHRTSKRIAKVGHEDAHSYAWLGGDVPLQRVVMDLKAPGKKSAAQRWAEYSQMVAYLKDRKALQDWDIVVFPNANPVYSLPFDVDATDADYYSYGEADWFLRELVKHVSSDPRYQAKSGEWKLFYDEVCVPWSNKPIADRNPGLIGSIFEHLAKNELDPENPNRPVFFHGKGKHRYLRRGDFDAIEFDDVKRIIEVKAYTSGPSEKVIEQAEDYAKVVGAGGKPPTPGYKKLVDGKGVGKVTYHKVVYVFPTQKIAKQWHPALLAAFGNDATAFETIPKHTGKPGRIVKLRANPTFEVALPKAGKKVDLKNPPLFHPGLDFRNIHLELDADDKIKRGRVNADLDVGGAVKVKNQPAEITPSTDAGVDGQIANDYRKAESQLEKLLGAVKPSVKITDKGVRATLAFEPGKSKLPGIDIEKGELSVAFEEGKLSVGGELDVLHRSSNLRAKVTVGYAGGQWSFKATTPIKEGLITGLSGFDLEIEYAAGEWTLGATEVRYQRTIGGVAIEGIVRNVKLDPKHGKVSGQAYLSADLGPFGKAGADATIANNELKRIAFTYDSPELKFPRGSGTPIFAGTVGGTIVYEDGKVSGRIRGDANLAVPGLKELADDGTVGLSVEAAVSGEGKFSGSIGTTKTLQFGKHFRIHPFRAKVDENGDVSTTFTLEVTGIKNVKDAQLTCQIENGEFKLVGGGISVGFGNGDKEKGDRMWGQVTVAYDNGLTFGGDLNVRFKPGMVGTGKFAYSAKTGKADLELAVDRINLIDKQEHNKNLFTFDKAIPVFSIVIIGLDLDVRFTLDFKYGFELFLEPKAEMKGLDLHEMTFDSAEANLGLGGELSAGLVATPSVGVGIHVVHPKLVHGTGMIEFPVEAMARLKANSNLKVGYDKEGGLSGDVGFGMALTFGITGAVVGKLGLSILDGLWEPDPLSHQFTNFTIMEPRELFSFDFNLNEDDFAKPRQPVLPTSLDAPPKQSTAKKQAGKSEQVSNGAPKSQAPLGGKTDSAPSSPGALATLKPLFKQMPGYAEIEAILEEAAELWETFEGVIDDIKGAISAGATKLKNGVQWVASGAVDLAEDIGGGIVDGAEWIGEGLGIL